MTLLERNLSVLKGKNPELHSLLAAVPDDETITAEETGSGDRVPQVARGAKKVMVHSRFDPVKEAERFISEIDPSDYDLIVVMGFGFAYHIQVLLSRMNDNTVLAVVEKNPGMIRAALAHRDLSAALADPRLVVMVTPGEDDFAEMLRGKSSKRVSFITHRGSHQLDPDYYASATGLARSFVSTKEVNIATLAKFEKIWSSNIARNLGRFIDSPDAGIFYGKFTGIPAIVVAAGPSLHMSMDFIRRNRDSALIVAVDTAYRILVRAGIEPHFCLAVDPQVINARYFEGTGPTETVLVTDPTVHPATFRLFRGRAVTAGIAFEMMKWIEKISGARAELSHGGSVSTNAYDFAKKLGASPVIMTGQDLAFTGGYAHARGSYLDEQVHLRTGRLGTAEMFNRRQLTALPPIFVRGIGGGRVQTNQKMVIFMSWFEKRNDADLINASAGGAVLPGIRHVRSEEIRLPGPSRDIAASIKSILAAAENDGSSEGLRSGVRDALAEKIDKMSREVDSIIPVLQRAAGFSEKLVHEMRAKRRDQGKVDYILTKLAESDRIIESKSGIKDLVSFTAQRVIHTITEGYDLGEDEAPVSEDEMVARRSGYLYRGLLEGALFNRKLFARMSMILEA